MEQSVFKSKSFASEILENSIYSNTVIPTILLNFLHKQYLLTFAFSQIKSSVILLFRFWFKKDMIWEISLFSFLVLQFLLSIAIFKIVKILIKKIIFKFFESDL